MSNKTNREYWRRRAVRYERDWNKRCAETVEKRLARHYERALSEIKNDILQLYGTFAKDNGLDFDEARQVLSGREVKQWRMSIREYLDAIESGNVGLTRELNTLAMRPRINRLEKLYGETLQELDRLGRNVSDDMRDFLSDAYKSNYARNIFDMVKIGGLAVALAKVDSPSVEKILATRWSGKNYSQRIWTNTKLLSRAVKDTVATGVHRGLSVAQLSKMVEDKMHGGYSNAVRLVRTEMNFVNNQAHADSMSAAGVAYYEFIATLDNRTSTQCKTRDGETYPLEEKTVGFNYPPLHPRCRSTVAPYIEGASRSGKRVAKVGGETIHIPASMSYRDYEAVYVRKEMTFEQWQAVPKSSKSRSKSPDNVQELTPQPKGAVYCKNFEELQTYWKTNYSVRLNKPLANLDFEAVREATQGIESVITEFPKAGKFLKKMKVENLDDAFMCAEYEGFITFSKTDFSDVESFREIVSLMADDRDLPKNTKIKGIAAHEMGHLLERALIDKYNGGIPEWENGTYAKKVVKEAAINAQKNSQGVKAFSIAPSNEALFNNFLERLQKNISNYAVDESCSETIAEAVCDYITNGENASRLSKEIWKLLKRELG